MAAADIDLATHLVTLATLSVLAGAFVGGMVFSLTCKVWTHIADRLAERLDARRAEQVVRLKAECWRLRVRNSRGGA
ncbi:hypothetical protein [Cupriavidus metallidurans]|uniref:hypothetical protein n=1 Tax=Cupriavidus metallidurans TaxID=119219 RepID=UPI000492F328|nr:hypothetical protein [Cupriavidus metallidurans]